MVNSSWLALDKKQRFPGLRHRNSLSDDNLNVEMEMDVFMTAGNSLSDDSLNIESEMDVFMTAVDLISHLVADEKEKYIEKMMGCVHFPQLTGEVHKEDNGMCRLSTGNLRTALLVPDCRTDH